MKYKSDPNADKGEGAKNPKILRMSYLEAPLTVLRIGNAVKAQWMLAVVGAPDNSIETSYVLSEGSKTQ